MSNKTQQEVTSLGQCEHHTDKCEEIAEAKNSSRSAHHRLDSHDDQLRRHGDAIGCLETGLATNKNSIDYMDKRISSLITAVWGLVLTLFGGIVTLVITLLTQGGLKP